MSESKYPSLKMQDVQLAEFHSQEFFVTLRLGTPLERILEPDFWGACARILKAGCRIICICESPEPYFAELLVREASRTFISVALLRKVDLPAAHVSEGKDGLPNGHSIQFLGPEKLWAAMRDDQVLKSGMASKSEAMDYMDSLGRAGAL